MPWNCLCSSKDKRRPEISAPILNNEDIQKLQLIPLKKPLITSEHLQQKLVQPENNNSTTVVIVDVVPDCHDLDAVVRIDDKCVQKKQLNKKQKEKQNNKAKPSNLKKQLPSSTTTNPNNVENDKISKQLTNVKFTFEVNDTHNEKRKESDGGLEEDKIRPSSVQSETKKREEKIEEKQDQPLNDKSGNYDELPLIRIEEFADNTDDSQQLPKKSEHFSKSSESIPFIDESPRHQPQSNLFETRYITIEPQNIGSQSSKNPSNNNNIGKIESIHTSAVQKREQFDKSAQILYQSQMQLPVAHHFEMVQRLDVKLCQVCHEFLLEPKSVRCLTCGFVCHESCVATKKNYDAKTQQSIPKSQSFPLPSQYQKSSDNLGLNYVTERILGSVLPRRDVSDMHQHRPHSEGPVDVQLQDKYEKELILMLEQKHGKNYKMFDLESCISTITLEKLCELCKHIDSWLGSGREKVVVLQDRGDKQRLGAAIAAYLKYLDICASNYPKRNGISNEDIRAQNTIARNWLDLDMFSMRKFLEDVIGPLRVPSHCRYLNYFSGLLSGKIKMNSSPLYLKYVSIESPPSWMNYDSISTQSSEWRSFIKVYEGLNCVYTSDIHVIPISTRQFVYEVGQLRLRGDVIIRCYQLLEHAYLEKRELMFSTQFHTCAVTDKTLSFSRSELDYACDDPRFPSDHRVTLSFSDSSPGDNRGYNLKSPLVTIEPMNAIAKYDSLENFNDASSPHTHGPLDGSLYATILKSPKTPERSSSTIPQFPTGNNNNNNIQSTKQGATQNLISPPPEFSNHKKIEITERHSPYSTVNTNSVHNIGTQIRSSSSQSNRYTPTPTINYEEIRVPSRSSSREIVLRNSYSHQSTPRPSSSQSQYLDQRSSVSRASNYTPNPSSYPPTSHQVKAIESYHYTTVDNNNSGNNAGNYQDGRESVRSPLTLSMDSGISSSGIVNRRVQGSSVSPSSFPSQTSPQEDRQRELDDILSDMLLTVQDIPDIVKCKQHNTLTKKPQQNNNQIILTQHQQRSSSTTSTNTNQAKDRERDFYDTSSTTTTITPPPSESGRDTPIIVHTNSSNSSTLQHQRDKRESTHMQQQHRGTGEQIMDLQNQSFSYPQQVRTDIVYVTSEDEEIPYHAREDSRPFTYGNPTGVQLSPNGTGMLKMQSGLSSPSLVRKTLGSSTTPRGDTHKKTGVRNDFEEMLLQRREKVLNEKYSIGDKTPNGSAGQYGETKWSNISAPNNNGYHYHEPLKRSNTMDGGFGRSYSTDETSGQTWLQLQQQKLRAKKEQQNNGAEYFARKIHTENRNRPLRSRSSAAHRYDGYASDTAAFDVDAFIDEVDYRRPLHVQTPHNRSSDRNYHTITTTTTTKERPFVSVKRAHEQAKLNTIGSSSVSPLSVLNASPLGHISQAQSPNGLLSFADSNTSPRNGHVRLESEILTNGNDKPPSASVINTSTTVTDNENACGQLALDRLLKSLAIENNKIEEQLDHLNNGNGRDSYRNGNSNSPTEIFKFPPPIRDKNHNKIEKNDSLNDVIANLTDFTRHETMRQSLTNGNRSPSIVNNNRQYLEPTNNVIKRLASESENSSSISPSLSERSNGVSWSDQVREESFSSYRSETEPDTSIAGSPRPETPAFPVTPRTPYGFNLNGNSSPALPPKSPTSMRRLNNSTWSLRSGKSSTSTYDLSKDLYSSNQNSQLHQLANQNDPMSCYTSRRNSTTSNANSEPQEVAPHLVKFVRDSSKYWYKPNISREEAVALLRNAAPGTFIVRDSTTFAKAYGLVVKVAYPPPGIQSKGPPGDELVRHFLVEPTTRGVRLKGCSNEPVFTSLSALVYQHSITPLALPCRLIIPDRDMQSVEFHSPAQQQLITQGAACNVLYLFTCETESLTGPEAVRKAITFLYSRKPLPKPTEVHFKVSHQGITLTDQTRQLFFRKHYPAANISHCGLDPEDRRWSVRATGDVPVSNKSIFAFVARRSTSSTDNQCHVFCELEPSQPATAITSFTNKIIPTASQMNVSKNI
ncbi:uncharacterized protein LOC119067561 isoform X2 [Bradysia coprophila]|uniref:uncharacterized protein LOC119067561 isoform X2 n=1 Tax=Bradysia coprophila TaxID=38358 RepID=UPI00187DA99C|nr:uncharacterized protein LOC119067561 isoform X2 [Bradysia coprophila]